MRYVGYLLLVLVVQLVVWPVLYNWFPEHRGLIKGEDRLVENLSALLFLISGLLSLWLFFRLALYRRLLLLVAVLGFVGFLDEISFGERLFDLSMPSVRGWKVDGVHDIVERALRLLLKSTSATTIVLGSLVFGAFVYRKRLFDWMSLVKRHPPYLAFVVFAILISVAVLLDARVIRFDGYQFAEEVLEMNAALALIVVCLCSSEANHEPAKRSDC